MCGEFVCHHHIVIVCVQFSFILQLFHLVWLQSNSFPSRSISDLNVEFVNEFGKVYLSVGGGLLYRTTITQKKIYWRCRQYRHSRYANVIQRFFLLQRLSIIIMLYSLFTDARFELWPIRISIWNTSKFSIVVTTIELPNRTPKN